MNDIDRSVEAFDFAIRRRFVWKEIKPEDRIEMLDEKIRSEWKDEAVQRMKALNDSIENIEGLNRSYHIGPAYFIKLNSYEGDFDKLWYNHIESLLREYLRGMPEVEHKIEILKTAYDQNGQI